MFALMCILSFFNCGVQVLRGGDRNVDVIVRDSHWNIINAHYWKQSGVIEVDIPREGSFSHLLVW